MSYIISPPAHNSWKIESTDFLAELLRRWPGAKVEELPRSEHFSHMWTANMQQGVLEGRFYRDGRAVALDGDLLDCIDFALWFRSLVPLKQELWFYDQEYSAHVSLKDNTNAATIAAAFE